jgi:rubrerythrin
MQQRGVKKMLEILQSAIQMEMDGKEFYQQASQKSSNKLAKELFQRLASEEDDHRGKFEEIYEALKKGQDWPAVEPPSEEGKRLKSIFAEATKELGSEIKIAQSELEAIETAMSMELKTYDLYRSRGEQSTFPLEKRFYQALAAEERGHHLALLDSYEYLTDPAGWFTVKEHWTLEGG